MGKKKSLASLENINDWKIDPDPRQIFEISSHVYSTDTGQFFSRRKKQWLCAWGVVLILIIYLALKDLLVIKWSSFFTRLKEISSTPYFSATLIFGILTFFIFEVWIRTLIIKLKLGSKLKHVTRREWFQFSILAFFIQSITPFSVGSEPYNIWWLSKKGVPVKDATAATAASSICWFIAQFLVTWPSFIYLTVCNWNIITSYSAASVSSTSGFELGISQCYWLMFTGLLVDIVMALFIFSLSYWSKSHYFISKLVNNIKKYMGLQYLTSDDLFHKYLKNSTFKKLYLYYLLDVSTLKIIFLYLISNVWVYFIFAFSHRLFLYNVDGAKHWHDFSSLWNSYHLINVATTSNNFSPVPSAEGTLQLVLKSLMRSLSGSSLASDKLSQVNNYTILMWRFFCKYLGLIICASFICWLGLSSRISSKSKKFRFKIKNLRKNERIYHELIF